MRSEFKIGSRYVIIKNYQGYSSPGFLHARVTVVPIDEVKIDHKDARHDTNGFKLDTKLKCWNSVYFTEDDHTRFIPEELFDSPLYRAIHEE